MNKQAIRTYRRIADEARLRHSKLLEIESQWDGGEFSAPALGRALDEQLEGIAEHVGQCYGVDHQELMDEAEAQEHEEFNHFRDAVGI